MSLEERITRRFHQACANYQLIADGDYILVGLSGGKDSLCLLELLARRSRARKPQFRVEAIHVRMENIHYETSTSYLERFCRELDVPLHLVTTHFDAPREGQREKPACFLCSWARRKQLFNLAQQLGCNKIALGHHQDDIIHTALMNLFYQGHFATMPARLRMRKMPLTIIRPLCLEHESDIAAYAELRHYEKQLKLCPNERDTNRTTARRFFEEAERLNPETRHSIWNALESEGRLVGD